MVLKATLQKEISKESLPKVTSERAVRCSSNMVFLETSQYSQKNICAGVTFQGIVQNQVLRPRTLRPWILWPRTLRSCDPQTRDSGTLVHSTLTPRNLELSPWNLGLVTLRPRTLRIELVTQIPSISTSTKDWINFNCKSNFDNKKLRDLSPKLRCSSSWTEAFTKSFWHLT